MNDEVKNNEGSKITEETTDKPRDKNRSAIGSWLLALIALSAIGLSVMIYFQVSKLKADGNRLASTLMPIETEIKNLGNAFAGSNLEKQQLKDQLVDLQQQQSSMVENLQTLFRRQNMGNSDWALAEIEYLLIVATHRLQLELNVPLALAAMQAADDRLKNNRDPGLLIVRQQITSDINALKAVEAVDIAGLVLFLSDLVGRVIDLPLQQVKVTADDGQNNDLEVNSSNWEKLLSSVWHELRNLVQISRSGEETLATLIPDQQYFLYQNLRLQLESARYAVLRQDTENLHVSVDIIASWLNDYFDVSDNGVANIIESISQMAKLELNPALPDISSSLESVRAYIKALEVPLETEREKSQDLEQM